MKLLNNDAVIKFRSMDERGYHIAGGVVESIQMLPDTINYRDFDHFSITGINIDQEIVIREPGIKSIVINPVFIFTANDWSLVGQARHGSNTGTEVNGLHISSKHALFQIRMNGVTAADRMKLAPFYKGVSRGNPLYDSHLYWAVATAIAEYGVELKDSTDQYRKTLTTARNIYLGDLDYRGGVSVMGVDWAKTKWDGSQPTTLTLQGNSYILQDGRRINLPENVKHVGKFEELFILEHKNGKVKEGSILCLLNSKEHDPNTLALVEHQIKAAENLAASLRIFAEVLKAEGQTVEPAPLSKKIRTKKGDK